MARIKKVLNSSVVLVHEENNPDAEFIVLGKGIGYGCKAKEELALDENCKTFIPVSGDKEKQIVELMLLVMVIRYRS